MGAALWCEIQAELVQTAHMSFLTAGVLQVRISAAGYLSSTPLHRQLAVYAGEDVTLLALIGTGSSYLQAGPDDAIRVSDTLLVHAPNTSCLSALYVQEFESSLHSSFGDVQEALQHTYAAICGGVAVGRQAGCQLRQAPARQPTC